MIPVVWLVGAAVVGAVVVAAFWKEIAAWLKRVWEKLPPVVKQTLQGAKSFIEKVAAAVRNVWYYYSYNQETQKWTETVVSREVDESSIPKEIRAKMKGSSKIDITDEAEGQLKMMMS